MPESMRLPVGTAVAVTAVAGVACAYMYREQVRRAWLIVWEGGDPAYRSRQRSLKVLKQATVVLDELKEKLRAVEDELHQLSQQCELRAEGLHESSQTTGISSRDGPHGLQSSYYHFKSDGTKLPNKWDSFDVDAELERLDEDNQPSGPASAAASIRKLRGKINSKLGALTADLQAVTEVLDGIRGEQDIRARRKELTDRVLKLHDQLDACVAQFAQTKA